MQLTFRGCSYEVPDCIQYGSASIGQPHIKLIYRAIPYYVNPSAAIASEAVETDEPTVTLTYRANTYELKLQSPKAHQIPSAISWCYQILAEG